MERIIIILGIIYFIDALLEKFNIYGWFMLKAMKSPIKLIYDLSCCKFCIMFHLTWIITFIYGAITGFSLSLVVVPFVVSGLIRIIEKR